MLNYSPDTISFILITIITIASFVGYLPQIIKLIETKKSEGISKFSWITWFGAALAYLIYAIIYTGDIAFVLSRTFAFILTVVVLYLTFRYSKNT